jgi:hypothetical protein
MSELIEGTLLRWRNPQPGQKPLGIVIAPPLGSDTEMAYVLMADHQANMDVEVFIARPEATGVGIADFVLERMEVVEDPDPALAQLLGTFGPNWWHVSAHLDGAHEEAPDPECLVCQEADERGAN